MDQALNGWQNYLLLYLQTLDYTILILGYFLGLMLVISKLIDECCEH